MTADTNVQPAHASFMVTTWRWLMWAVLVFGVAWIYWSRAPVDKIVLNNTLAAPMTGFLAPDFTLQTTTGDTIQLSALHGRPVIINFWATWCPPCRAEMPTFEQVWQDYKGQNLMILALDQGETVATIERFERAVVDMAFPILLDSTTEVGTQYGVRALPTTYFIDAEGRIQDIKVGGSMDLAMLMDGVNQILEK
jgi:cytochrome c biogenesis protein CcmG, thiol:disulfide interchange protein DsbE